MNIKKLNEELIRFIEETEITKPDLSKFKFTDYRNEDAGGYRGRETYKSTLQSVLDQIDRTLTRCRYNYDGGTPPRKQVTYILNDIWGHSTVRDILNLSNSTVKNEPQLQEAIKAVREYQEQLRKSLEPLNYWNGKEWIIKEK